MEAKIGARASVRCAVGTRKIGRGRIIGKIEKIDPKTDKVLKTWLNTATADFKKLTAQGCAVGTFNAINKGKFDFSVGDATVNAIYYSGGTGVEDYVVFDITYTASGGAKTLNNLYLGYDIGGGGEVIYCENTGMTDPIADQETVTYRWTISFVYDSGGLTDYYRYHVVEMMKTGVNSYIPSHVNFLDTTVTAHVMTTTLNAGGDGVEVYHEWISTYTHSGATITIDIVILQASAAGVPPAQYIIVQEDIVNKALADTENLTAYVRIEHL